MEHSLFLAGIIGPILMALSLSEYLNFKIWKDVHPTVVYLNGLVLLTMGIVIVRIHPSWTIGWPLIITIIGWLLILFGLLRMFFPNARQLEKNTASTLLLFTLLLVGVCLSAKAYLL